MRNCPDVTILNSLFGLCLFVYLPFCVFIFLCFLCFCLFVILSILCFSVFFFLSFCLFLIFWSCCLFVSLSFYHFDLFAFLSFCLFSFCSNTELFLTPTPPPSTLCFMIISFLVLNSQGTYNLQTSHALNSFTWTPSDALYQTSEWLLL